MKHQVKYLIICVLLMLCGCEKDYLEENTNNNEKETLNLTKSSTNNYLEQMVIYYPQGTTETEKESLRQEYGVSDYKLCKCGDSRLELWLFSAQNSNPINIEEKLETVRGDEEIEGADGNPLISLPPDQVSFNVQQVGIINDAVNKIVNNNNGITVAVLDTGINYNYNGFSQPFLYNASQDACYNNKNAELFGWNFVDNNNDPFDDHPSMHGTVVSHIITTQLNQFKVPHQILPIKIADQNGNISYFDALCGFQYAAKKPSTKIINMSFGWYNENYDLLGRLIQSVEDRILVVSSAGNNGQDNDVNPHYPSSYDYENVLSVASVDNTIIGVGSGTQQLSYFSNFGANSVDVAALGENIPFFYDNQIFYYNGTSFSAAVASSFSALHYQNGMSIAALKGTVISNCIYSQGLSNIQHSAYIPQG